MVLKRFLSRKNALREHAMLRRVLACPKYYVQIHSAFHDEQGTRWIAMHPLGGTGLGPIPSSTALRRVFTALLMV